MPPVRSLLAAASLVLVVLALNSPTWEYGFVYDDHAVIEERKPAWEQGWRQFLGSRQWGMGRHATALSLDLDRREPLGPRRFHVTNSLLAALATVLVFALARALGLPLGAALTGALLFAVHPVHTDAVVSIVGRAEVLATVFVLACVLLHIHRYRPWPAGVAAAALLFFLGLASKESAFALFAVLALYDLLLKRDDAPAFRRAIPYAAYAVATAAWVMLVLGSLRTIDPIVFADNPLAHAPAGERIAKAAAVLWQYLALTLLPAGLKPDRAYADTNPTLAAGLVGLVAWLAVVVAAWALRRRAPRAVFAVLWFPASFAVTGNIIFPLGTLMAERLLYLPSVGPALLAALAFERAAAGGRLRRGAVVALTASAALLLAFAYDARGRVWTNDEHYHRVATFDAPTSAKAHYDRGLWLARTKDYEAAEREFKRALAIVPAFSRAAYYLASTYQLHNRPQDAIDVYVKLLEADPSDAGALSQLANLQLGLGREEDALATAQRMVALEPDNADHRQFLALIEEQVRLRARRTVSP